MKGKLKKTVLTLSEKMLTNAALKTSTSACGLGVYQPKEPKCLREK
ncbi:cyclic lactone autoinducer peptide [Clostridiaceae bacterium UIB06]|uniref:Cyclic lactone autoinducer peptide n=1 Tax=Clostridium thailandense TaxID=2794346 RepID=A0A949WQV6_9CLOT|nr:cyclic lactone autoinducer peptide [Clostridium thailandense]MBV7273231.1 cyclic lactone autoinducer peptide [Clostridium thailandense]MCH5136088.1 cyclic lactone autoinducer peptide [Clostridiaceae bacterium UIB06]